jgi:hypothetical protein
MVAEYVEVLWESGEAKSLANYTLAAIQHFKPQSKQHLPWSWKLVKVRKGMESGGASQPCHTYVTANGVGFCGCRPKMETP